MIATLKSGEDVDFMLASMTSGRGRVLAVDAVAVRLQVFSRHSVDEERVYPWPQIAWFKVLQGTMPEETD